MVHATYNCGAAEALWQQRQLSTTARLRRPVTVIATSDPHLGGSAGTQHAAAARRLHTSLAEYSCCYMPFVAQAVNTVCRNTTGCKLFVFFFGSTWDLHVQGNFKNLTYTLCSIK